MSYCIIFSTYKLQEMSLLQIDNKYSRLKLKTKLRDLSLLANYTDRVTAACWRSYQLLRIEVCHVVSLEDPLWP
jgi:hypothetical protein